MSNNSVNDINTLSNAIKNILHDNKFHNCINYNDKKGMEDVIKKAIGWVNDNIYAKIEEFQAKKEQLEQVSKSVMTQTYTAQLCPETSEEINDEKSEYIQKLMDQNSTLRLQLAKQQRDNKLQNESYIKQNNELRSDNDTLKKNQSDLKLENKSYLKQTNELLAENNNLQNKLQFIDEQLNQLQDDYEDLEIKFKQKIQNIAYKSWQCNDVFEWIITIENQRFKKYENQLLNKLKEERIDGTCLDEMDTNDLHRLGITEFKDKKILIKCIEKLIKQDFNDVINKEGESTAFH